MAVALRLAVCVATGLTVAVSGPAAAASSTSSPAAVQVFQAPARTLGEPAVAVGAGGDVVTATDFLPTGAVVRAWQRAPGAAAWQGPYALATPGEPVSYDSDAAVGPGGSALVVTGAAAQSCISGGVVELWSARPGRRPRLLATVDRPRDGGFDDRPAVAAAGDGTVAVAWSHGSAVAACDVVGRDDAIEVAVSRDGGRHFAAPLRLSPPVGAFGARVVVLPGDRVAVAWVQPLGGAGSAVELATVAGGTVVGRLRLATLAPLPQVLPGASFYAFTAPSLVVLGDDLVAVGWPAWTGRAGVLVVAVGRPGGPWSTGTVRPPPGADLLLPGLLPLGPGRLLVVGTEHRRATDSTSLVDAVVASAALPARIVARPVSQPRRGPGYREIGEVQLGMAGGDAAWVPVVLGGSAGATLTLLRFADVRPSPPAADRSAGGASGTGGAAPGGPTSGHPGHAAGSSPGGPGVLGVGAAVVVLALGGGLLAARGRHRR